MYKLYIYIYIYIYTHILLQPVLQFNSTIMWHDSKHSITSLVWCKKLKRANVHFSWHQHIVAQQAAQCNIVFVLRGL